MRAKRRISRLADGRLGLGHVIGTDELEILGDRVIPTGLALHGRVVGVESLGELAALEAHHMDRVWPMDTVRPRGIPNRGGQSVCARHHRTKASSPRTERTAVAAERPTWLRIPQTRPHRAAWQRRRPCASGQPIPPGHVLTNSGYSPAGPR